MSDKLKACPFCGNSKNVKLTWVDDNIYIIGCENLDCLVMPGNNYQTKKIAIKAWNTRTDPGQEYCTCSDSYRIEERCVNICGDCKKLLKED